MVVCMDENESFQKRVHHGMVSHARFKMADGHIHFVSLLLGLFLANNSVS